MKLVKQMNTSPLIGTIGTAISLKLLLDATKSIQQKTKRPKKYSIKPYTPKYTWKIK